MVRGGRLIVGAFGALALLGTQGASASGQAFDSVAKDTYAHQGATSAILDAGADITPNGAFAVSARVSHPDVQVVEDVARASGSARVTKTFTLTEGSYVARVRAVDLAGTATANGFTGSTAHTSANLDCARCQSVTVSPGAPIVGSDPLTGGNTSTVNVIRFYVPDTTTATVIGTVSAGAGSGFGVWSYEPKAGVFASGGGAAEVRATGRFESITVEREADPA